MPLAIYQFNCKGTINQIIAGQEYLDDSIIRFVDLNVCPDNDMLYSRGGFIRQIPKGHPRTLERCNEKDISEISKNLSKSKQFKDNLKEAEKILSIELELISKLEKRLADKYPGGYRGKSLRGS